MGRNRWPIACSSPGIVAHALRVYVQDGEEVDPSVLSTFPPSVQYEMLLRNREAQQVANRAQFQERAAGAPQGFSVFQMQKFLQAASVRSFPFDSQYTVGKRQDRDAISGGNRNLASQPNESILACESWQQMGKF